MAFPTVADVTLWNDTGSGTSHLVQMPATVNADDLLLVLFCNDGGSTVSTPSGWTEIFTIDNGAYVRFGCYIKSAVGDEDGTTVDFETSAAELAAAHTYRIQAGTWGGTTSDVEAGYAMDADSYPDPPNLAPSWGAADTLWIAGAGINSVRTISDYPDDYTDTQYNTNDDPSGVSEASCRRERNATSENPTTFTLSSGSRWIACTVAIEPAAAARRGIIFKPERSILPFRQMEV